MILLESVHLFGLPGLSNAGMVSRNGLYRGADPSPEGYRTLRNLGIVNVLNLSRERDLHLLGEYGINEIYSPIDFFRDVDDDKMKEVVDHLLNRDLYPLYVHCAQGRDRTGMAVACYRIRRGWSNEEAINEMWSFGFHFVWSHFLDYVKEYK